MYSVRRAPTNLGTRKGLLRYKTQLFSNLTFIESFYSQSLTLSLLALYYHSHSFIMFSKLTVFTVATFAIFASAAPTNASTNQCNVGKMQCCNSVTDHSSETGQAVIGVLGAVIGSVTGLIGANCTPITAVGLAGNSW